MKEEYKELREDVLDEKKTIEETLERLYKVRNRFDSQMKDYSIEPAMGTYLEHFKFSCSRIRMIQTILLHRWR